MKQSQLDKSAVFPTPVGVFLIAFIAATPAARLPHARGGVSPAEGFIVVATWSSPRPWGCFLAGSFQRRQQFVFPTPVGVFPRTA